MNDSENLKNDDQLLSMMEEMQNQIEDQQKQLQEESEKNSEAQKTISRISSENSILRNKLQEKSERIEKMNESDLIVKKNEELEKKIIEVQNSEKKTREEAEAKVEAVKRQAKEDIEAIRSECNKRVDSISERESRVSDREMVVRVREKDLDGEVSFKATTMVENQIANLNNQYRNKCRNLESDYEYKDYELERKYRNMKAGYKGVVFFILLYSILETIITAWKTEAFAKDFISFFTTIFKGITMIKDWIWTIATFIAKLGDMIPYDTFSAVAHWILVIVVAVGVTGGLGILVFLICKKYYGYFRKKQTDEISIFVALITLIIVVFLADQIKDILSINLLGLMLLVFVLYTIIRGLLRAENKEAKEDNQGCWYVNCWCWYNYCCVPLLWWSRIDWGYWWWSLGCE